MPIACLATSAERFWSRRTIDARGRVIWKPRPQIDLDEALSAAYGLPVDTSAKRGGLAAVAAALNDRDIARAQIATLLLHLSDLPVLAKRAESPDETLAFAAELFWSGLLKGDWDPEKHPRTGEGPILVGSRRSLGNPSLQRQDGILRKRHRRSVTMRQSSPARWRKWSAKDLRNMDLWPSSVRWPVQQLQSLSLFGPFSRPSNPRT
jgi:hypothetical protein